METYSYTQQTERPTQYRQQSSGQGWQATAEPVTGSPDSTPAVDILDNTDEIWVFVDLPGFRKGETQLRGDETTLVVSAERIDELEEGRSVLVRERPTRVERTIPLPATVDVSDAEATYEDGVCKVILPKAASDQFREIEFD
ncbi:MAG: Hsp20/alpha crystallin family protein [Haloarculaceae archaeon]